MRKMHEYLICIDSDGCAMDTMDIKHFVCFGPCLVEEWNLCQWKAEILKRWNEINLYTMSRGINRFKGLAKMLREVNDQYVEIEDVQSLEQWVETSSELSNKALLVAINETGSPCLKKALNWSNAVNEKINYLAPQEKKPFQGVKEAIQAAADIADVVIVSSANRQAVIDEWELHELLQYVKLVMAQDAGSKAHCIGQLLKQGYSKDHVLVVGDAPGDYDAVKQNGVLYYPICVGHEAESWKEFKNIAIRKLLEGSYQGDYQEEIIEGFLKNLQG